MTVNEKFVILFLHCMIVFKNYDEALGMLHNKLYQNEESTFIFRGNMLRYRANLEIKSYAFTC